MLQTHRTDNSAPQDTMPPEFGSPAEFVAEGLAFLRRRLSVILLTCFVMFGAGLLYLVVAVPTFTATAQLIVDAKTTSSNDTASATTAVESQVAILKSESVARAAIAKLGLAGGPGILRRRPAPPQSVDIPVARLEQAGHGRRHA
ncbi:Wzz/FepE/Etk N-terminal domain-containing protein [Bradyrhizobium sp. USDA 4513]